MTLALGARSIRPSDRAAVAAGTHPLTAWGAAWVEAMDEIAPRGVDRMEAA